MKKLALSLALLFAAGIAMAQQAETKAPDKAGAKTAGMKFQPVQAEVISTDVEKMTITYKADGVEKTSPVGPVAKYRLTKLKAGDKVVLSCKFVNGEFKEVTSIRPAAGISEDKVKPQVDKP